MVILGRLIKMSNGERIVSFEYDLKRVRVPSTRTQKVAPCSVKRSKIKRVAS